MAGVMLDTGRFDKAGPLLDRAIELERLGADRLREGIALCMRAALRVATGDVASARQDWQEGVRHMHATNSQVPLETARRRFVTACEAAGVSLPPDDE